MEKALYERIGITIAFTYVREYMLDSVKNLLSQINDWCEEKNCTVEVIVNDWGMAGAFGLKNLRPCLGILLNKRKKDPRISYKKGDQKLFEMNNLNADFYRNHLANEFRIQRFEWESCGYEQQFPEGKNSLHIPLYQTNTSQYCPLRDNLYKRGKRTAEPCKGVSAVLCRICTFVSGRPAYGGTV